MIAVFPLKTGDLMFVGFDSQNTFTIFSWASCSCFFPGRADRKTVIGLIPKPVRIIMALHLDPVLSFLCETHAQQGIFTHWLGVTEISQISKPHRINLNT